MENCNAPAPGMTAWEVEAVGRGHWQIAHYRAGDEPARIAARILGTDRPQTFTSYGFAAYRCTELNALADAARTMPAMVSPRGFAAR